MIERRAALKLTGRGGMVTSLEIYSRQRGSAAFRPRQARGSVAVNNFK
jgi:hypothetical protein